MLPPEATPFLTGNGIISTANTAANIQPSGIGTGSVLFPNTGTSSAGSPQPILSLGCQIVIADPTSFVVTPSPGAPPVTVSPGGPLVTVGDYAISLGSSGTLVVGNTTTTVLGSPPGVPLEASALQSVLPSGATVITSVVGGSTVVQTFVPTTFSSLTGIKIPQTTFTTLMIGPSLSVIPITIGPGRVAWKFPSQTAGGPILTSPMFPLAALLDMQTSSTESQTILMPAQVSTSTGPDAMALGVVGQVISQNKDPEWMIEAPLSTVSTTTNPVLVTSMTTGVTKDGHSNYYRHPLPIFVHSHCFISIPKTY